MILTAPTKTVPLAQVSPLLATAFAALARKGKLSIDVPALHKDALAAERRLDEALAARDAKARELSSRESELALAAGEAGVPDARLAALQTNAATARAELERLDLRLAAARAALRTSAAAATEAEKKAAASYDAAFEASRKEAADALEVARASIDAALDPLLPKTFGRGSPHEALVRPGELAARLEKKAGGKP